MESWGREVQAGLTELEGGSGAGGKASWREAEAGKGRVWKSKESKEGKEEPSRRLDRYMQSLLSSLFRALSQDLPSSCGFHPLRP